MKRITSSPFKQNGSALLAFVLLLIVGTSYLLVSKLNANVVIAQGNLETREALSMAKQTLIGYAATYPDHHPGFGPGYLPCPDGNNDGFTDAGSCALSATIISSVGRFPYKTLETEDIRDNHGERIWYVLSNNFRNNPKLIPLNSETAGGSENLTVNGVSDVAAVLFAPGAPIDGQNRNAAGVNNYANYIDAVFSGDNKTITTGSSANFLILTKDELMKVVEERVLGEVGSVLKNYKNTYGAYPWLTPFADPKSSFMRLSGTHTGSNNSASLDDTAVNFNDWNVQAGDIIVNSTDGSVGIVSTPMATSLTVNTLTLGTDDDFDTGDEYVVYVNTLGSRLRSTADAASSGLTLVDTNRDFNELGVLPGDVIDKYDGSAVVVGSPRSSGMVQTVSANQITVGSLAGTATNSFTGGDAYTIRSNWGVSTAGSSGMVLEDRMKNFSVMGVRVGDLIVNSSDGSYGRISAVTANTLTVLDLVFGTSNDFTSGDYYYLPRFNTDSSSREGLLSIHDRGEGFKTGFDIDWSMLSSNGTTIATPSGANSGYVTKVTSDIETSSSTYSVSSNDGTCVWINESFVDCNGKLDIGDMTVNGVVTSGTGNPSLTFIDSSQSFITKGVKRGDIIQNFNDEYSLSFSRTIDSGNCGTATTGSSNLTLKDSVNNFLEIGVSIGDVIYNTTDGSSGTIASVTANQIMVTSLNGGADNSFSVGDSYQISDTPRLYDAGANLLGYEPDGPFDVLVRNNATGIQGVVTEIIDNNSLVAESYPNSSSICFSSGNGYSLYTAQKQVVTSVESETKLWTASLSGNPSDFDTGEYYRIKTAAKIFSDDVDGTYLSGTRFREANDDLIALGVEKGDIVRNKTNNNAYGIITDIYLSGSDSYVTVALYGGYGWRNNFENGDNYEIYYNYVDSRKLEFHVRFNGGDGTVLPGKGKNIYAVNGVRKRSDCIGYGTSCSSAASASDIPYNFDIPTITITDYEDDGDEAGTTTSTIPNTGSPIGNIKVSNMDYYLVQDKVGSETEDEIPGWFLDNKWHQLIYIAYSEGDIPGAASACVTGTNCLTLENSTTPNDDKRAIAIIAGEESTTRATTCGVAVDETQNRTLGQINDYFEEDNCSSGDDDFSKKDTNAFFNDHARIIE